MSFHRIVRRGPARAFLVASLLATSLSVQSVRAAQRDEVIKAISDSDNGPAPGCVVGVFKSGKAIMVGASGLADVQNGTPLDPDTLFYAASVSKQFTALAVATLIQKGKVHLQDDVRTFLPELPQYEVPVTVEMLMHHSAGIRDSLTLLKLAGSGDVSQVDKNTALAMVFRQKATNFTPGTAYGYSNGGFLLLAEIVERVSGMAFADYVAQAVLKPMGITRSGIMRDARLNATNVAHGYVKGKDGGFEIRDTYPHFGGSGGLMISINDFAKYDHDIQVGHKVWTPEVAQIMETPGRFTNGSPVIASPSTMAYAAGLMVGQRRGQNFVEHGGTQEGFRTNYARIPDRKLGVAVFCNRGDANPANRGDAVIDIVEGHILAASAEGARPNLNGKYQSSELEATYEITTTSDGISVIQSSALVKGTPPPEVFKRDSEGSYVNPMGVRLRFDDDRQGFALSVGRVRALHFSRLK